MTGRKAAISRPTIFRLMKGIFFKKAKANHLTLARYATYNLPLVRDYANMVTGAMTLARVADYDDATGVYVISRPELVFNIDETSITSGFKKNSTVWLPADCNEIVACDATDGKLKNITALMGISLSGETLEPLLVHT